MIKQGAVTGDAVRALRLSRLRTLWIATGGAGVYGSVVRFALLTAQRSGNGCAARLDELDLAGNVWRIPSTKFKSGIPHEVPLTKDALDVITNVPRASGEQWAFPDPRGGPLRPAPSAWRTLLETSGIIHADTPRKSRAPLPIRFYDLRRSVWDALTTELGVAVPVAEAVFGHAAPDVETTYNPEGIALREKRAALELWAAELRRIVAGTPTQPTWPLARSGQASGRVH